MKKYILIFVNEINADRTKLLKYWDCKFKWCVYFPIVERSMKTLENGKLFSIYYISLWTLLVIFSLIALATKRNYTRKSYLLKIVLVFHEKQINVSSIGRSKLFLTKYIESNDIFWKSNIYNNFFLLLLSPSFLQEKKPFSVFCLL